MKSEKEHKSKWINIRITPEEYEKVYSGFKQTTSRKLSIYVRDILLHRKITVCSRSKSLDDFMEELILLRKELSAIANNFNQVVRRINGCQTDNELKLLGDKSLEMQRDLISRIAVIQESINQFSDRWLQE